MVKVMNGGFPRVAKFVSIFTVKFVRIVFDFHGFSNEAGGVFVDLIFSGGFKRM